MMRFLILAAVLALTGCLGGEAPPPSDTNTTSPDGMVAALPAPIEDSQEVTGSADPANMATGAVCASPSANCVRYPFTLNRTANFTADLTWTLPASDFDFYLQQDGTEILRGANDPTAGQPATTSEHMEGELEAGEYEIVVVPWSVARDTFTLTATFS